MTPEIQKILKTRVVQQLRLHAPNSGSQGSMPGQGTRAHTLQLKSLYSAAKTQCSQTNVFLKILKTVPEST